MLLKSICKKLLLLICLTFFASSLSGAKNSSNVENLTKELFKEGNLKNLKYKNLWELNSQLPFETIQNVIFKILSENETQLEKDLAELIAINKIQTQHFIRGCIQVLKSKQTSRSKYIENILNTIVTKIETITFIPIPIPVPVPITLYMPIPILIDSAQNSLSNEIDDDAGDHLDYEVDDDLDQGFYDDDHSI